MYNSSDKVLTVKTDNEDRKRSRVEVSVGQFTIILLKKKNLKHEIHRQDLPRGRR